MATLMEPDLRLPLDVYVSQGREAGIRWTELRLAVLRLFRDSAAPLGAYEAAARLTAQGTAIMPTSMYRCLRALDDAGLVVPIVTWRRFLLSPDPAVPLWGALLCAGCRSCTLVDLGHLHAEACRRVGAPGFRPRSWSVEAVGCCRACAARDQSWRRNSLGVRP